VLLDAFEQRDQCFANSPSAACSILGTQAAAAFLSYSTYVP